MNIKQKSKRKKTKRPRFLGLPKNPPSSKRICLNCDKLRTFKYNKFVGHSECIHCGSRFAKRKTPQIFINK